MSPERSWDIINPNWDPGDVSSFCLSVSCHVFFLFLHHRRSRRISRTRRRSRTLSLRSPTWATSQLRADLWANSPSLCPIRTPPPHKAHATAVIHPHSRFQNCLQLTYLMGHDVVLLFDLSPSRPNPARLLMLSFMLISAYLCRNS